MDRNKVDDTISSIGIPANVKGFDYIADAMEVFEEHGYRVSVTGFLYPEIAKRNSTTSCRVERAIRHAFEIASSTRGDSGAYKKYIGVVNTTNAAALTSLYKHIKRESDEPEQEDTNSDSKGINPELESAIRRIIREELNRIVSG